MSEIQRYANRRCESVGGSWVLYDDHLADKKAALEAQAACNETNLTLKYESWRMRMDALNTKHAAELAALRGEGGPALLTFTHEDINALREGCNPVRIHRDFEPSFLRLCGIADNCGVEMWPTHSIRYIDQEMLDLVVKKAKRSNHLAGSGVDLNPVYDGVWYTNEKMNGFTNLPPPVKKFLNNVGFDAVLRWGGTFGVNKDRVHFDDDLVRRDPAEWSRRTKELQDV